MMEAILALIAAIGGAFVLGRWRGGRKAKQDRAQRDARDYRDTRKEIDNADLGHGATDDERVERLREIAERRSGKRND